MVLNNTQIEGLLVNLLAQFQQPFNLKIYTVYASLYAHGFRLNELADISRFQSVNDTQVSCQTSKGGGIRIIEKVDIETLLLSSIEAQENYFFEMHIRSYERIFREKIRAKNLTVKQKSISTHLFRHNRMKTLSNEGFSNDIIKDIMGIKRLSTVNEYVASLVHADDIFL